MKFSLLSAAAATMAMVGSVTANCEKGPFVSTAAGMPMNKNPGYQQWCESRWEKGSVITGIKVWAAKFQIKAVQFRFTGDDWGKMYGQIPTNDVQPEQKTWDETEKIGIRIWNNKPDDGDPMDAVGRIQITQEGKEAWEAGADKKKTQKDEVYVDNPSGKLLAVKGAAGAWVTSLEFKFLESPVTDVKLTDMKFKEDMKQWNEKGKGFTSATLGGSYFANENPKGGNNVMYDTTTTVSFDTTKSITTQQTHTLGYGVDIKSEGSIGLPGLFNIEFDVTHKLSYSYANMKGTGLEEKQSFSHAYKMASNYTGIAPQKAESCSVVATMGTFDSDYEGTLSALMANGKTFNYKNVGHYKSIGYANAVVRCKTVDINDVPKDFKKGEVKPIDNSKKQGGKRAKRITSRLARFIHGYN